MSPKQRQRALDLAGNDNSIFRPASASNPKVHCRFTCAQVIMALEESGGVIAVAAKRLGCARSTMKNYVARYPVVRRALKAVRTETCDIAKCRLAEEVRTGSLFAAIHYIKLYDTDRGRGFGASSQEYTTVTELPEGYDDVELIDDL